MALMTYMIRDRNSTYYFRRAVPEELRAFMPAPWTGKAVIKLSHRTKNPKEAKIANARRIAEFDRAIRHAEKAMRGETTAPEGIVQADFISSLDIENDVVAQLLNGDELERELGDPRRDLLPAGRRPAEDLPVEALPDRSLLEPVAFGELGMAEDHHHAYGLRLDELLEEYRQAIARRDIKIVLAELKAYLRQRGIAFDPTSLEHRRYGIAILQAHLKAYELMRERQAGKVVETPKPAVSKGPKLSEAAASWRAGSSAKGASKPSPNTILEADHAVRRFLECHGDLRLGDIDKAKTRHFRDELAKVPTRLSVAMKKLTMAALFKRNLSEFPPAHANTINKSLQLLSTIITRAQKDGKLDHIPNYANPFKDMKLATDERLTESRKPFSPTDLKAIFSLGVYANGERSIGGGGEAAFWIPLLALFTGARQNELAQLRLEDLRQDPESAFWFFDIDTSGGRTIKTKSSRRHVPMHRHLEQIGLFRYRDTLIAKAGGLQGDLWPDVKSDANGRRAGPWSKWFNRHLREVAGIEDRMKVFHSFRHTFKRMARDAGVPEELSDALTGHSGGGVGRSYGGGFGLKALADGMAKIGVPEALRGLHWQAR